MAQNRPCLTWSSPLVPYERALQLQMEQIEKISKGEAKATIFFLEHPPVITVGKVGKDEHILEPEPVLKERGIQCVRTNRGGDVTFHGPGQLVVYFMIPLEGKDRDIHGFLRRVEQVGLNVLSDFGIQGRRAEGYTGVWVGDEKIMAIGVGVKKWVTYHGLAFNYDNDLQGFSYIVPCGISDRGVTSLHFLLNREIGRPEIETAFRTNIAREFGLDLLSAVDPLRG